MNRTLKRPMFRIGGPVNQGSGIMSHVEPRRVHRADGGRIGYAQAGQVSDPFTYYAPNKNLSNTPSTIPKFITDRIAFDEQQRAAQQANREKLGITSSLINEDESLPGVLNQDADIQLLMEKGLIPKNVTGRPYIKTKSDSQALENLRLAREIGTKTELYPSEDIAPTKENKPTAKKEPEYVETPKTDPREAIKKDRDFLKSILEGEDYQDMSRGEAALVIARAIAEPGPIANKIKVANELAIPIIRSKRKEDRELTLEAYKTYREKEIEDIKAGRPGDVEKRIRARADAYIKGNPQDPRTQTAEGKKQILDETWAQQTGEDKPLDKIKQMDYATLLPTVRSRVNAIKISQQKMADNQKLSKEEEKILRDNISYVREVRDTYPEYFRATIKGNFKTGGRVGFAEGTTDPEYLTDERPTVESTPTSEDAGTQQSQLKPVVKLSFQELRSRLPKEITNDIVGLISSSEQALQDFAYIKTQQDVNNFNIKYGVNLVLPSNR